jgi:hypothetical protein
VDVGPQDWSPAPQINAGVRYWEIHVAFGKIARPTKPDCALEQDLYSAVGRHVNRPTARDGAQAMNLRGIAP